ncbi:hypothetical protein FEZ41_12005 [Lentilactobacillus parafarraginis]|nr:hypothetical protein [Lentilactobacillus parafarraginis]TLQ17058.1 hypothetical protein FEZ41_12005 [Lentilactobacillus parafarraginis]
MKQGLKQIFRDMRIAKALGWVVWGMETGLIIAGTILFILLPAFYHELDSILLILGISVLGVLAILQIIAAISIYHLTESDTRWAIILIGIGAISNPGYFLPGFWTMILRTIDKNNPTTIIKA